MLFASFLLIFFHIFKDTTRSHRLNPRLNALDYSPSADPEGGDRGSRPPLRFVRGDVLCRGLTGMRGGQTIIFTLLLSIFFPDRFARQYYTNITHVFILPSSMFSMERLSFLYISFIQIMKKIVQLSIPCFYDRAFSFFGLELHDFTPFKPNIFWGRAPRPPFPRHIYNVKTTMPSVCVERKGLAIERRSCPTENNLYVNNCLESRFLTPKYVDVFFTLYLWLSMKSLYCVTLTSGPQNIMVFSFTFLPSVYEVWSLHAESIVSYSVNKLKDGQTCKVITIGFPYLRWRCPN